MFDSLSLNKIMEQFHTNWQKLPDHRQRSNNTRYQIADAITFLVFFMQSPSFLAHEWDVHQNKGQDNVTSLFAVEKSPRMSKFVTC